MMYDIQMKNDISTGAVLVVRIPEEDIDKKALYTIQSDQPEFLVPFYVRNIDGYAECTYQLGMRSELRHRFGSHPAKEYVRLWTRILQPLLDCEDWFLKASSFVLDANYLYVDKTGTVVSYIYIPSREKCVDDSALKEMVNELSNKNSTDDQRLENQVWRALAQDFQPRNFLQMLSETPVSATPLPRREAVPHQNVEIPPARPQPAAAYQAASPASASPAASPAPQAGTGDIVITIPEQEQSQPKKRGWFGSKKEKKAESDKEKKEKKGLFGGKSKKNEGEIVLGAAEAAPQYTPPKQSYAPAPPPPSDSTAEDDGETQILTECDSGNPYLRLVGDNSLPKAIPVLIQPGQGFTIGRFDVSVGQKQSDFEFEKRTKAVSRHHAVIERTASGEYFIKDLVSSAGTFLNGTRLTPNMSFPITRNDRISFGTCGADYVWEE